MAKWLTSKEFREKYHLSSGALWARVNTQKTVQTKVMYNKRFYLDEEDAVNNDRVNAIYCRVASVEDTEKLNKQVEVITEYCLKSGKRPDVVFSEVGSGYDNNREKFRELIKMIVEGKVDMLFIGCPNVLSIDDYDFIKYIAKVSNCEIETLNYNCVGDE